MSRAPLVTVAVTAYRRPDFLAEAVESVLAQTFENFELIVLEDGSHIAEPILRPYGDRVRYEWQPNQGQAAARNRAVSLARGEWVAFLDDDDRWMPEKLERQVGLAQLFPDLGLIHTDFLVLDAGVTRLRQAHLPTGEVPSGWVTGPLFFGFFGLPSTVMVRKSDFERAGGFDSTFRVCEDYDLLLRLSRLCPFGYLGEPLVAHRLHRGSVSDSDLARIGDTIGVLERFLSRSPELSEDAGRWKAKGRVADLYRQRARLLLWQDEFAEARRHLIAAWHLRPDRLSTLALLAGAHLPAPAIHALRALKRGFGPRPTREPRRTDA